MRLETLLMAPKGIGVLAGHNHHTRFQSNDFHNARRADSSILDIQPAPLFESDLHHSLVTLNDEEQSLTYYNAVTKQVIDWNFLIHQLLDISF